MNALHFLPGMRSAVAGIVWPAIADDAGAQLLTLTRQLNGSQWWSAEVLLAAQIAQLDALIDHAHRTVPAWRDGLYARWQRETAGAPAADRLAAWRQLPLLQRRDIQTDPAAYRCPTLPPGHGAPLSGHSSGSTGIPLRYWTSSLAHLLGDAAIMRDHLAHQRDFTLRHGFIRGTVDHGPRDGWGPPTDTLMTAGTSSICATQHAPERQLDWLREWQPHYLLANPITLRELLRLSRASGYRPAQLRQVRTIGETVDAGLRAAVRTTWGVAIADIYSACETGIVAMQCPQSDAYHVQAELALCEVLDANGEPCQPGDIGRIVVTPLHNAAMPLLRYQTGDYAEVGVACPCGRGLPVIARILGRHRNRLRMPDGRALWCQISALPWDDLAPSIRRFQLRQEPDYSLTLRYLAAAPLGVATIAAIAARLEFNFGIHLPLRGEHVAELPLSPAGKLEDFISLVPEDKA